MMGIMLQKFITNSHFVKKIEFQLLSPFLSLVFMWEKKLEISAMTLGQTPYFVHIGLFYLRSRVNLVVRIF